MKKPFALSIAVATMLATALAACGTASIAEVDDGTDASVDGRVDTPVDGGTDALSVSDAGGGDASACVPSPVVGTACTAGQKSCEKVDGCCVPQVVCDTTKGTWELLHLQCACPVVPCGTSTCPGTQYCQAQASGVDGGTTSYTCMDYPKACERDWTCACVQANGPARCAALPASCVDTGGRPTVTCAGQ